MLKQATKTAPSVFCLLTANIEGVVSFNPLETLRYDFLYNYQNEHLSKFYGCINKQVGKFYTPIHQYSNKKMGNIVFCSKKVNIFSYIYFILKKLIFNVL